MLSKAQISRIKSLNLKKYRQKYGQYTVEGPKSVAELLTVPELVDELFAQSDWIEENQSVLEDARFPVTEISLAELRKISHFKTPNKVLALANFNQEDLPSWSGEDFWICLDTIQDPGNLGTIVRSADWFGFPAVVCSEGCVDPYNPKVLQATMGSSFHISVFGQNLEELFLLNPGVPVYAAVLGAESIHSGSFAKPGFILIGNEGEGIRDSLLPYVTEKISIPGSGKAESLNAAVAASIIMAGIRMFK